MEKESANGSARRAHHPWDEVSLPGAGSNPTEEPTILQVLNNKVNAPSNEKSSKKHKGKRAKQPKEANEFNESKEEADSTTVVEDQAQKAEQTGAVQAADAAGFLAATASDNLVSSHSDSSLSATIKGQPATLKVERQTSQTSNKSGGSSQDHVLDIESHLIETYDDYQAPDESVGINELTPIQDELTQGSSKIETASNVRTVIEVEPAGAKTLQPIETQVQQQQQQAGTESEQAQEQQHKPETTAQTEIEAEPEALRPQEATAEIKETAEKLVDEIEREVLAVLSERIAQAEAAEPPAQAEISEEINETLVDSKTPEKTDAEPTPLEEITDTLSQKVDEQLSEVTSILKASKHGDVALSLSGVHGEALKLDIDKPNKELKIVDVPSPKTPLEAEERKLFLESLPHLETDTDSQQLSADCKREYYQSLRKYLVQSHVDRPPIPLQTYRWEDLRRARERGGYPWTHLYKRPLGPNEEPEIVLLLRKSQELRFTSESPKSLKKVRIDDQVSVKEAERYIQELSEDEEDDDHPLSATEDEESHSLHSESISCVSDSVLATGRPRKSTRFDKIRGYLRRRHGVRSSEDAQSLPATSTQTSRHHSEENLTPKRAKGGAVIANPDQHTTRCYPIMQKLKSMADRQKKRLHIKRINLGKDDKIVLGEETKILKLKKSPKAERGEIPHFIEKQDSDDVLEIVELDESPSRKRRDDGRDDNERDAVSAQEPTSIIVPDEIIELATKVADDAAEAAIEQSSPVTEDVVTKENAADTESPPKKAPRLRREHVYEEIESGDVTTEPPASSGIFDVVSSAVAALKHSLAKQDNVVLNDVEATAKTIPLDRMGSSEEEQLTAATTLTVDGKPTMSLLAPISSIDSTSSDEDRNKVQLSPVAEESDAASVDELEAVRIIEEHIDQAELKPAIKKESSPAPSDKKVTFSHVEDEAEPHREDIELSEEVLEATASKKKWKDMSDHEYEPIGAPAQEEKPSAMAKESSPAPQQMQIEVEAPRNEMQEAEYLQRDLEERYFSSEATTPRTESRTDYEIHTSQVDSSALEELPLKPENRRKGFMASAQDRTRKMQAGFKSQAGKIKTKLRSPVKKPPSGSPKAKERKRFKAPEFSKIKMPDIKRPDMSKFKDFKRPEFTKFNKPDMTKFKLPEKFSTLKLRRSKSLKENEPAEDEMSGVTADSGVAAETQPHQKKMFDFNFGTYPRAFRKKKKPLEPQSSFGTDGTEGLSVIPSTETQPSMESSSSPQGDRGPGPVRSRWADKFSDVSYNDSEGSRYRRYGSEQESFDRESSLERRMKEDLDETGSDERDLGILGGVPETKQFAEFDEENRAIHEISKMRKGEFKRRPMVHQDSDLRSEDSKDVEGWTDKEIQKNKLLRKAELEAEASYLKYPPEEGVLHETQSTASSGKKVVMEEIDDDEFFLRKRGISEDNMELRQYISDAIREGYDMPINALQHVGQASEPMEYGEYDVPPPKPRRLHKAYRPQDVSQDMDSTRSEYGDDMSMSQNGSDFFGAPKRPLRKGRSRSKYSMDSQDVPMADEQGSQHQYFDDDEEYLRPPRSTSYKENDMDMNNLDFSRKEVYAAEQDDNDNAPQAPRRRKRQTRDSSMDKDSYVNGFSGRSVSNSYLQPTEDVIVYRTEHEYPIPLATPEHYTDGASGDERKSRSASRYDEDERTSRGVDSFALESLDGNLKSRFDAGPEEVQEKYIIDMMENDGYAIVRKENIPKPTPPARRKKFSRSPGERFATVPTVRTKRSTPPPERPPPPRGYTPSAEEPTPPTRRKPIPSLEAPQKYEDDYEEPEALEQERPESPRNLQSGEIINRMKYRPLPAPPRPPREKRQRAESKGSTLDDHDEKMSESTFDEGGDRIATSSTADSYDQHDDFESELRFPEVEVSTQTDPLPDDFVCEEFEITDDMKVIEPRRPPKTLEEMLRETQAAEGSEDTRQLTEEEQLARGLQRFRESNQRSLSERSRATSQADRSSSLSRPQTPSAVVIERRVSTPLPSQHSETMLEASLIVRPIDDLDLEEEELRREGLLTDSSVQSKSDNESHDRAEDDQSKVGFSDYSSRGPSSEQLDAAVESLRSPGESEQEIEAEKEEPDEEVGRTMRDFGYEERLRSDSLQLEAALESLRLQPESEQEEEKETEAVERTMRDYGFDEDEQERAERYSNHYDEDEPDGRSSPEIGSKAFYDKMFEKYAAEIKEEDVSEDPVKYDYERKKSEDREQKPLEDFEKFEDEILTEEPPQPPPRRKSTTGLESAPALTIVEQPATIKEVEPVQSLVGAAPQQLPQLPTHLGDLEVERLRVHALQAGQIMVSQLHGNQMSSDELECKSGSLVVKNIELPPGFIEDIVERVRSTDRGQLLTAETQTSLQASSETLPTEQASVPPPKPPRHRDLESTALRSTEESALQRLRNFDEQTQTEPTPTATTATSPQPMPVYATTEYLQSLPPQAFWRHGDEERDDDSVHRRRRHHHHHRRHSCSSSEGDDGYEDTESRRHRSRSSTRPPSEPQSVMKAGGQFLAACGLSLVNIINQLTACIRTDADNDQEVRLRPVPTLVALFIVITFGLLIYLLSGQRVHTHHWDYFNPPGNEGRPS